MNWYLKVLSQYADFTGRARRKEYWMFTLFHIIIIFILAYFGAFNAFFYFDNEGFPIIFIILTLYFLATLLPTLAVTVRRLHDMGKSGWWYCISFLPYIGGFWLLVLTCFDSEHGPNKWGINPKGIGNEDIIDQIGDE